MNDIYGLLVLGGVAALIVGFLVLGKKSTKPPVPPTPGPGIPDTLPPIAFPPFIIGSMEWKNQLTLDFRYREHGCDAATGLPLLVSGGKDIGGGPTEHLIEVLGPDSKGASIKYAVYGVTSDSGGKTVRIDGRWVKFLRVTNPSGYSENNAIAVCVIGNAKDNPGYPISVMAACPTPPPPIPQPELRPLGPMTVGYTIRNASGRTSTGSTVLTVLAGDNCAP